MTRQLLTMVALFALGVAVSAEACANCGCAAKKTTVKPVSVGCPFSSCGKPAAKATKAACPASACTKSAAKACPSSCSKTCSKAKSEGYETINTADLQKLLASKKKVTVVDARSGKWDDGRRIGSAQQLAVNASEDEIAKALPNKKATIVAYCTSTKCPASAKLAHRLVDLGYKNVVKYPDGIDGWQKAGNDVKQIN